MMRNNAPIFMHDAMLGNLLSDWQFSSWKTLELFYNFFILRALQCSVDCCKCSKLREIYKDDES